MSKQDSTPTTFFSYSREDSDFVLRLAKDLRAAGARVWLDQLDIGPGQRWDSAVEEALHTSPRQVAVLSPAAVSSVNVMDEISFALEENKQVIPVLYRTCEIPFRLRRVQYLDFRSDYNRGLRELLKAVEDPLPSLGEQHADQELAERETARSAGHERVPARAAEMPQQVLQRPEPPLEASHPKFEHHPVVSTKGASKKSLTAITGLALLATALGIWYKVTYTTARTEGQILSEIQKRFEQDPNIPKGTVKVSVKQGSVTLSGSVSSELIRQAAISDAAGVDGVKIVDGDSLQVSASRQEPTPHTKVEHRRPPVKMTQPSNPSAASQQEPIPHTNVDDRPTPANGTQPCDSSSVSRIRIGALLQSIERARVRARAPQSSRATPQVAGENRPTPANVTQPSDPSDLAGMWQDDRVLYEIVPSGGGRFDMRRVKPPESDPVYRHIHIMGRKVSIAMGRCPSGHQTEQANLELSVDGNIMAGLITEMDAENRPPDKWVLRRRR
jgi:TIR domain/BON domain